MHKANRGNESSEHLAAKKRVGEAFSEFTVFYEVKDCDVLVIDAHNKSIVAIEVDSSPRNVARNIQRNFSNGCHAVAVLSLYESQTSMISKKAEASCSESVAVFGINQFPQLVCWAHQHLTTK